MHPDETSHTECFREIALAKKTQVSYQHISHYELMLLVFSKGANTKRHQY
jgi:hypothetical protein